MPTHMKAGHFPQEVAAVRESQLLAALGALRYSQGVLTLTIHGYGGYA